MATGGISRDESSTVDHSSSGSDNDIADSKESSDRQTFTSPAVRQRFITELSTQTFGGTPFNDLSKTAQKKLVKIRMKKEAQKIKKQTTKQKSQREQHQDNDGERLSKKVIKTQRRERVREALSTGLKVAIDCSMEDAMSPKEICKLCRQIQAAYGSNSRSDNPFHLYLTGLKKDSKTYVECQRQCPGFENYLIDVNELMHHQLFKSDIIVYLTPDSPNLLQTLDPNKVYIIGGLVDENLDTGLTYKSAQELHIETARLPVDLYMNKTNPGAHCVMPINHVMNILLDIHGGHTWPDVFSMYLPQRKGFVLKPDFTVEVSGESSK